MSASRLTCDTSPEDAERMMDLVMGGAERLRLELERRGIRAQVRHGDGLALVSIGRAVDVWVEWGPQGLRYRWWTGRTAERTGRYLYAVSPTHAVEAAARLIAAHCRQLRATRPAPPTTARRPQPTGAQPYRQGGNQR